MVTFDKYVLENSYINDFGQTARKLSFRRSNIAPEAPDTGGLSLATKVESARCSGGSNFYQPRYLEALLNTGTSYQYVLPDKSLMKDAVYTLVDNSSVDFFNYFR